MIALIFIYSIFQHLLHHTIEKNKIMKLLKTATQHKQISSIIFFLAYNEANNSSKNAKYANKITRR